MHQARPSGLLICSVVLVLFLPATALCQTAPSKSAGASGSVQRQADPSFFSLGIMHGDNAPALDFSSGINYPTIEYMDGGLMIRTSAIPLLIDLGLLAATDQKVSMIGLLNGVEPEDEDEEGDKEDSALPATGIFHFAEISAYIDTDGQVGGPLMVFGANAYFMAPHGADGSLFVTPLMAGGGWSQWIGNDLRLTAAAMAGYDIFPGPGGLYASANLRAQYVFTDGFGLYSRAEFIRQGFDKYDPLWGTIWELGIAAFL
jgi:hypothetical protein